MKKSLSRSPVHERIADDLRAELQGLSVGTRIPAESELAARYEVSVPTLRLAMTILVGEGFVDRRHGSGTYRSAGPVRERTIGVLVSTDVIAEPCAREFFLRLLDLLLSGLDRMGVAYRLFPARKVRGGCHEFLRFLESGEAAGLLLASSVPQDVIDAAAQRGVPIFGRLGMSSKATITSGINYTTMVGKALDFFQRSGCRRPALLAWSQADRHLLEVSREAGPEVSQMFKRLAEKNGLSTRNEWLCTDLHPADPAAGWSGLREVWSAARQKPDALLVADSKLLPGAIEAVRDLGIKVPRDLCVLSHCNVPESTAMPPEIARLEYRISDWADPLLEGVRRVMQGDKLERQSFEVNGTLIESGGSEENNLLIRISGDNP